MLSVWRLLFSCSYFIGLAVAGDNKKPTTVASRGLLSRFDSSATSPGGVAVGYDDRDGTHPDHQRIH
jgi:hypothetical protein